MASYNRVILMGNLTRDPEVRFTSGGLAICKFGLAMNRRFTTAQGEEREEVCFVDIEVFGKQAESTGNYLRKGAPAFVEGILKLDQWEDAKTKEKRSKLLVRADRVQFLGAPTRGSGGFDDGSQGAAPGARRPAAGHPAETPAPQSPEAPETADAGGERPAAPTEVVDDIPF